MTEPLRLTPARPAAKGEDIGDVLASIRRLIAREQQGGDAPAAGPMAQPPATGGPAGAAGGGPARPAAVPPVQPPPDHPFAASPAAGGAPGGSHPPTAQAGTDGMDQPASLAHDAGAHPIDALHPETPARDAVPALAAPAPDDAAATDAATDRPCPASRSVIPPATLAQAVDAAAARMEATARRIEAARAARDAPFRLAPDALIPPAETATPPAGRLRLSPGLSVVGARDDGGPPPDPAAPAASGPPLVGLPAAAASGPASGGPSPVSLSPADRQPAGDAAAPDAARGLPSPAPARLPPFPTEPAMTDATPLRQLLRDAIRDELQGELGTRLDGDLRQMVREELAAALTEAFSLSPAAPQG